MVQMQILHTCIHEASVAVERGSLVLGMKHCFC